MWKIESILSLIYVISNLLIAFAFFAVFIQFVHQFYVRAYLRTRKAFWFVMAFALALGILFFYNTKNSLINNDMVVTILLFFTAVISWILVYYSFKRLIYFFNLKGSKEIEKVIEQQINALKKELNDSKLSESNFKAIANSCQDFIILMTADYKYQFINDAFDEFINFNKLNFIGKTPKEILSQHPHTNLFMSKMAQVIESGQTVKYEIDTVTGNSGYKHFAVQMSPVFDKHGNLNGIITITKDISFIKLNEQKYAKLVSDYDELTKKQFN
jgi:PAS domain S-box-containing protein